MFVVLVYDTAVERNPNALRTCRQYLHWVQRSVFEGELSTAQHRSLMTALRQQLDLGHDSVRVYRIGSPHLVQVDALGTELGNSDSVL
ncbi:CRISPR-associated endonuclease Cas2 [Plantactinospora sp. KBS50]|uniref:CRISPR-associated endonuclease Cas2 n=1 Tax=Plantactinospora sp. KBS50 TaxID=2024580 RepID=UPI000BAAC3A8|nr:CRISPR-associated endonuclease Cas2 [Plantactinospora sp. KBS50]ASW55513.1 CRISPR-associated endonuclease Cas2 [Plantactinospora sp. KBS50]